jgi:hypothetical protein
MHAFPAALEGGAARWLQDAAPPRLPLSLVPLSTSYDLAFGRMSTATCTHCSTHPEEPALCLVCGEVLCGVKRCCKVDGRDGVKHHVARCTGSVGVVLLVNSSQV